MTASLKLLSAEHLLSGIKEGAFARDETVDIEVKLLDGTTSLSQRHDASAVECLADSGSEDNVRFPRTTPESKHTIEKVRLKT
ncbi:MAG: hypothetical protein RLO50_22255 [Azospirillaceae bacterium]